MSTVPPGMGAPMTAPPVTQPKRVSSAGYWIALAIFLLGCGAALVWFIIAIVGIATAPDDYARTSVPSTMRVDIASGKWALYHEAPGISDGFGFALDPDVSVTDPAGDPVILDYGNYSTTYSTGGHEGREIASFEAHRAGVYTIDVSGVGGPNEYVAIGRPLFESALPGIVGSIALGSVCFLVALVLLIITIVRRGRAKRAMATAPYRSVPPSPGSPGSFAAPIPTAPVSPYGQGPPPAPGAAAGQPVPPPPGAAPAPNDAYTPGWAAPDPGPAAMPPPPAPSGFTSPGAQAVPPPPVPSPPPVPTPPAATPPPPAPAAPPAAPPGPPSGAESPEPPAENDAWDEPGTF